MQKKKTFSIPVNDAILLEDVNQDIEFLKCKLLVISEGLNRNGDHFTLDSMKTSMETFRNKPILISYKNFQLGSRHESETKLDPMTFELYDSYMDQESERPVGIIPLDSEIQIEEIEGKPWITLTAYIWKKYAIELTKDLIQKAAGKDLRTNKRVSAEITLVDDPVILENEVELINGKWIGNGITILGDHVQEAVDGANIRVYSYLKEFAEYVEQKRNSQKTQPQQEQKGQKKYSLGGKMNLREHFDENSELTYISDMSDTQALVFSKPDKKFLSVSFELDGEELKMSEEKLPVHLYAELEASEDKQEILFDAIFDSYDKEIENIRAEMDTEKQAKITEIEQLNESVKNFTADLEAKNAEIAELTGNIEKLNCELKSFSKQKMAKDFEAFADMYELSDEVKKEYEEKMTEFEDSDSFIRELTYLEHKKNLEKRKDENKHINMAANVSHVDVKEEDVFTVMKRKLQ